MHQHGVTAEDIAARTPAATTRCKPGTKAARPVNTRPGWVGGHHPGRAYPRGSEQPHAATRRPTPPGEPDPAEDAVLLSTVTGPPARYAKASLQAEVWRLPPAAADSARSHRGQNHTNRQPAAASQ